MVDTPIQSLSSTPYMLATDVVVIARGLVPYVLPGSAILVKDAAGNFNGGATGTLFINNIGLYSSSSPFTIDFSGSTHLRFMAGANERVRIDTGGNLLVGRSSPDGDGARLAVSNASNAEWSSATLALSDASGVNQIRFFNAAGTGAGAGATAMVINKNNSAGRSINAAGTINAAGADYAEYLRKASAFIESQFAKGQVLGINSDGELTPRWSEAHSFVIKSYDPAYVGGDTWSQHLGPKPEAPAPIGPKPELPAVPQFVEPMPTRADDETDELFGLRMADWLIASRAAAEAMASANSATEAFPAQFEKWTAAKAAFDAAQAAFETERPLWEAAIEEARAIVDRVAFSGQVPVIVEGAYAPGQYLIAHEGPDDTIICRAHDLADLLADPALAYRKVGKVWAVREVKLDPADEGDTPEMVTRAWANVLHG